MTSVTLEDIAYAVGTQVAEIRSRLFDIKELMAPEREDDVEEEISSLLCNIAIIGKNVRLLYELANAEPNLRVQKELNK